MLFPVKGGTLFLIVLFAAGSAHAQQTPERSENSRILATRARSEIDGRQGTSTDPMSSDDRLSVISAAFGRQGSPSKVDCSHLVHEIYNKAGFPYSYSNSSELYSGISEFRRVTTPQVADLIVWPGHMGIIVSPTQHAFYSSLRSGVGVDFYDSSYWRGRGKPRFYRYVKSTITAATPAIARDSGSNEEPDSSTDIKPASVPVTDSFVVDSARPEQIRNGFLKLSKEYGKSFRAQDLLTLPAPLIVFDQVKVERLKVKGQRGTVDIQIDGPLALYAGRLDQKKRHDRQRWTINKRDQTTWQLGLSDAAVYLSREDAARLFAQQLAQLTAHPHDENSGAQEKAELARALNALLSN